MHIAGWQQFRGPLVAFAVALGLAAAGRLPRTGLLAVAAGGAGVLAGWYTITGRLWILGPPVSVDELTALAAVALLFGLFCTWRGPGLLSSIGVLLAALAAGWILSGAPSHQAALRATWPIGLGVTIAVLLFVCLVSVRALEPMCLALAGLTLAAALDVVGAPANWTQLALVPGLAALAMLVLPPMSGLVAVPVAIDIAALGCLAVIAMGRLGRLAFAPVDAAALSPLLAVCLLPHTTAGLRSTGRAAPLAGCLLAGSIAVGCVWLTHFVLRRYY